MRYIFLIITVMYFTLCISCDKQETYGFNENDSIRGIWGSVALYDAFGNQVTDIAGVQISAHCVDTLEVDTAGNPTLVFDTTMITVSDNKGNWMFDKAPGGNYFILFSKDGFCNNAWYNYSYDTLRADTLETIYLSVKPEGSIHLDNIALLDNVLSITRTLSFDNLQSNNYMLSTWYFFDTVADVSSSKYAYSYVSGASISKGGSSQSLTIQKPLDKLYQSGIKQGQTVYIRGYVDNAKYVHYQISPTVWVYPNISEGSEIKSFIMPEE